MQECNLAVIPDIILEIEDRLKDYFMGASIYDYHKDYHYHYYHHHDHYDLEDATEPFYAITRSSLDTVLRKIINDGLYSDNVVNKISSQVMNYLTDSFSIDNDIIKYITEIIEIVCSIHITFNVEDLISDDEDWTDMVIDVDPIIYEGELKWYKYHYDMSGDIYRDSEPLPITGRYCAHSKHEVLANLLMTNKDIQWHLAFVNAVEWACQDSVRKELYGKFSNGFNGFNRFYRSENLLDDETVLELQYKAKTEYTRKGYAECRQNIQRMYKYWPICDYLYDWQHNEYTTKYMEPYHWSKLAEMWLCVCDIDEDPMPPDLKNDIIHLPGGDIYENALSSFNNNLTKKY